jgi:hypothetical protein
MEKHESAHDWQSVGPAKKRKRTQRQQQTDHPNHDHLTTNNKFEALTQQQADDNIDPPQLYTQPIPRPPPIIIYGGLNYKKIMENITTITEEQTFQCKVLQNDSVKINTNATHSYRKLFRHLNSEEVIHHTHQMKQNRAYRAVIQNLYYSIPVDEIKEELKNQGHTVRNIINILHRVHKHPLSMFYGDLDPQHNNEDIYILQYLSNMKMTVEPPNKTALSYSVLAVNSTVSKSYCTRPYKCVKCGGTHMTTDRQKSKDTGQMRPVLRGTYR